MQITACNADRMRGEDAVPAPEDAAAPGPSVALPARAEQRFPPALRTAGRTLAAIAGMAAGAAMFIVGGLYALLTSCVDPDGETAVCGSLGGLVGPLEFVAVLGGAAAAIAGGIATAATGRARWIAVGMTITIVLVMLLTVLVGVQELTLR